MDSTSNFEDLSISTSSNNFDEKNDISKSFTLFVPNEFAKIPTHRIESFIYRGMVWNFKIKKKPLSHSLDVKISLNYNDEKPKQWSLYAAIKVIIKNLKFENKSLQANIRCIFKNRCNKYHLSNFFNYQVLNLVENGFLNEDNHLLFYFEIMCDYPIVEGWDSRKETSFVGLVNLGTTCYMNSILQSMFHTSQLRLATYMCCTKKETKEIELLKALQKIFFSLQFSDHQVEPNALTKALGWDTHQLLIQEDAHEFWLKFIDKIEEGMKGTNVENTIEKLYKGKQASYIKCLNVEYESVKEEIFYDIRLNVEGSNNIYESFEQLIKPDRLEGSNKYNTDSKYGFQDAEKGLFFKKFPPILHLQLLRFAFSHKIYDFTKIIDRFEFYKFINLDKYIDPKFIDPDDPAIYELFAIIVHIGSLNGGHYVVYVNPGLAGQWYKFDDNIVFKVSEKEAIDLNFGGNDENVYKLGSTAYVLIYDRCSMKDHLFKNVTVDDISVEKIEYLNANLRIENNSSSILDINIQLYQESTLYQDVDKTFIKKDSKPHTEFLFKSKETIEQLYFYTSKIFGFSENSFDLYYLFSNDDVYYYPKKIDDQFDLSLAAYSNIKMFIINNETKFNFQNSPKCLVFVKYLNDITQEYLYFGHLYIDLNLNWDEVFKASFLLLMQNIFHGLDIQEENLSFEVLTEKFPKAMQFPLTENLFVNFNENDSFVVIISNKNKNVILKDNSNEVLNIKLQGCNDEKLFDMRVPGNISVQNFFGLLSKRIKYPMQNILICQVKKEGQFSSINEFIHDKTTLLKNILKPNKNLKDNLVYTLLVKLLEFDVKTIQDKTRIIVQFLRKPKDLIAKYNLNSNDPIFLSLYVNVTSNFNHVVNYVKSYLEDLNINIDKNIRILQIRNNKISLIVNLDVNISRLEEHDKTTLYIDEIPQEQLTLKENQILSQVIQIKETDVGIIMENPFIITFEKEATFKQIKDIINSKIGENIRIRLYLNNDFMFLDPEIFDVSVVSLEKKFIYLPNSKFCSNFYFGAEFI